jgi:hypothetical protein
MLLMNILHRKHTLSFSVASVRKVKASEVLEGRARAVSY